MSYVCVPYGGGSAVVYQPLADALPLGHALWSVAIPGHDVGLDEDSLPFAELARRCADEVLARVEGPLVLYGHCGVGGALVIELARLLELAGREIERVYTGAVFPFAKPRGRLSRMYGWLEERGSNRVQANWLKSMGVDLSGVDPVQADRIISNMRRDGRDAAEHFTDLLETAPPRLRAPIISVVGERDPVTDYHHERYREWHFLTDTAALVVLAEAGHFFLRYRADELADVLTRPVDALADPPATTGRWWPGGVSHTDPTGTTGTTGTATGVGAPAEPGARRFALISAAQLVSLAGSTLTGWAIPVWIYTTTGSLTAFGLTGVATVLPILLATPLAGAVADRYNRRRVILGSSWAAAAVVVAIAFLLGSGDAPLIAVLCTVWLLSFASTFQRIAYTAAIPQLVPKRYLGHANGIAQLVNGIALLFVPLLAAGLYGAIGLRGIVIIDLVTYAVAIAVLLVIRFPDLMGQRRLETFSAQLAGGARLSWGTPAFRAMLVYYGVTNLLYAVPVLLVPPLVLGFAGVGQVGQVALGEGLGVLVGGLAMTIWGGPARRRMVANILAIGAAGVCVALSGLRPSVPLVILGVFGTALGLSLANGIYLTIVQTKVPQRFHGRVIALNQTLTWSTLPIGFLVLVPLSGKLQPLLDPGGALATTVGRVLGTGSGRGLGLAYVLCGLGMVLVALVALRVRLLTRLDEDLPDAPADDLIGLQALAEQGDDRAAAADARPRTPTERRLAAAWAAALDWPVARIGRHDSFADLGGGSLSAMRVVSSLDGLVTLPQLLDTPALSELAAALDRSAGTTPAGSGTARADAAGGATATAVRAWPATAGRTTARRVAPAGPATMDCAAVTDVAAWATAHRTELDAALRSHGAVHLSGLPVRTPADLAALRDALGRAPVRPVEPFADRTDLGHDVWSAPEWGADREQCLHHDESYSLTVPGLLLFACLAPARTGGELLLGDTRAALAALPPDLAARFRAQGWRFERTFRPGFGPRPATAFGTDDVAAIERACAQRLVSVEDQRDGVLRLSRLRSALVTHPVTGEECWFNDVGFFSAWTLDPAERALLHSSFGERGLPFDARFGDGQPIGEADHRAIVAAYEAVQVRLPWRAGDVVLVDNLLTAHGREPFTGTWDVAVAAADPLAPADCRPTVRPAG
ncbi:MFS transporter [Dactylosporangium sp. NPDC050688]|uniref:MFS transporter n=1 Tax=Dactylosporangium sp. NPDC050688 TaxID=3157217 RepID=UPI0033C709B5